jgi:hypothetical protein
MSFGRLRVALAAAACALAIAAAPAAAVRTEMAHMPASTPEVAGDSVVFFSFAAGTLRLVRAQPGAEPAVLREFDAVDPPDEDECCTDHLSHAFSASPSHVAVSRFFEAYAKGSLAQSDYSLRAGPLGGELRQLFLCQFDHPFDVDGTRIAYVGDHCTERSGSFSDPPRLVVRDLAGEGTPVLASFPLSPQAAVKVDLAGDHVAYSTSQGANRGVFVRELGAASDAYRVPTPSSQWSLQPDGRVAIAYPAALGGCRIDWHSKAEPTAHRLDVCPLSRVVLAGDRIAFQHREGTTDSIDVVTLDGSRRSVVLTEPGGGFHGFDWDGTRLAYTVQGCRRADDRVYVGDLATDPPLVEGGECAVAIAPKTVRASRSGLVRLRLTPEDGADGTLVLYRGNQQATTRLVPFEVAPGATRSVPNRVHRGTFAALRKRGSLVLQARASVIQRSGSARTYRRAIRVLAPK